MPKNNNNWFILCLFSLRYRKEWQTNHLIVCTKSICTLSRLAFFLANLQNTLLKIYKYNKLTARVRRLYSYERLNLRFHLPQPLFNMRIFQKTPFTCTRTELDRAQLTLMFRIFLEWNNTLCEINDAENILKKKWFNAKRSNCHQTRNREHWLQIPILKTE